MIYMIWTCSCSSAVCKVLTNRPNDLDAISYLISNRQQSKVRDKDIPRRSYNIELGTLNLDHEVLVLLYSVQPE